MIARIVLAINAARDFRTELREFVWVLASSAKMHVPACLRRPQ